MNEGGSFAIHVLETSCPHERTRLAERWARIQQSDARFLPKIHSVLTKEPDQLCLVEEWVDGLQWDAIPGAAKRMRAISTELFDTLEGLNTLGPFLGSDLRKSLRWDLQSCRLRVLGQSVRPSEPSLNPLDLLSLALQLSKPYLDSEEKEEATRCAMPAQVSRLLRRRRVDHVTSEAPFVGREECLTALNEAFGTRHLLMVEGGSGIGKTRLLKEWTRDLDARVLWSKADRDVAPTPYAMFAGPVAVLEAELESHPELKRLLVHKLGLELPLLQGLQQGNSTRLQRGTLVMLSLMLAVFGREVPTVLVLDDCQWADPLTLRFLEYWAESGDALLVVAMFRRSELPDEHSLKTLAAPRLELKPFTTEEAQILLTREDETASLTLRESAIRRAQGNPLMLLSFLKSGLDEGDLEATRFTTLKPRTQEALAVASVLGRKCSIELLTASLQRPVDLEEALAEGLVELTTTGLRFVHDRFREIALRSLHVDRIAEIHLRVARHLDSQADADVFEVAFHFQAAGASAEGFVGAVQAGEEALREHALDTAIFYLSSAVQGSVGQPDDVRCSLLSRLGDCYRLTGAYDQSLIHLQKAMTVAGESEHQARLWGAIGDVYFKQGNLEAAQDSIWRGLALLGCHRPKQLIVSFLAKGVVQLAHSLVSTWEYKMRCPEKTRLDLLRADLYNRLAYVLWFLEGPIPSIWAHLCELNLAERYYLTGILVRARSTHAIAMGAIPLWPRALRYGQNALKSARQLKDQWAEGQAGHFYGATLLGVGRLEEAREHLEVSVEQLEQTGDRWEENGARYHLALTYYRLGRLDDAVVLARETQLIGAMINDRLAAGDNLFTWARACGGRLPLEVLELEKTFSSPDVQRQCELLATEALIGLRRGDLDRSERLLKEAIALYDRRRAQNIYTASLPCWLATVQRRQIQSGGPKAHHQQMRAVRRTLKRALSLAHKYRTNLSHAHREQALVFCLEEQFAKAEVSFRLSLEVADSLAMAHEVDMSQRARRVWEGKLGSGSGQPEKIRASVHDDLFKFGGS